MTESNAPHCCCVALEPHRMLLLMVLGGLPGESECHLKEMSVEKHHRSRHLLCWRAWQENALHSKLIPLTHTTVNRHTFGCSCNSPAAPPALPLCESARASAASILSRKAIVLSPWFDCVSVCVSRAKVSEEVCVCYICIA